MSLPLYREARDGKPELGDGNTGLWYDKFCNAWRVDFEKPGSYGSQAEWLDKKKWIGTVENRRVGDEAHLTALETRLCRLTRRLGGATCRFTLDAPFVTGIGRPHPIENGMAWHHTLGVPFLPGSSVKGLIRAWAETWSSIGRGDMERLFGKGIKKPGDDPSHVGGVMLMDALPTAPLPLRAEIITPHYNPYVQGGEVPGDWFDPVPIPLLAVERGATFRFAIAPRKRQIGVEPAQVDPDCARAMGLLTGALECLGAGAKTAVGFGRFVADGGAGE